MGSTAERGESGGVLRFETNRAPAAPAHPSPHGSDGQGEVLGEDGKWDHTVGAATAWRLKTVGGAYLG